MSKAERKSPSTRVARTQAMPYYRRGDQRAETKDKTETKKQDEFWVCDTPWTSRYQYMYVHHQLVKQGAWGTVERPFLVRETKEEEGTRYKVCTDKASLLTLQTRLLELLRAFPEAMVFAYDLDVTPNVKWMAEYTMYKMRRHTAQYTLEPQAATASSFSSSSSSSTTAPAAPVRTKWNLWIRGEDMEDVYPIWEQAVRLEATNGWFEMDVRQSRHRFPDSLLASGNGTHQLTDGILRIPAKHVERYESLMNVALEQAHITSVRTARSSWVPFALWTEWTPHQRTLFRQRVLDPNGSDWKLGTHGVYRPSWIDRKSVRKAVQVWGEDSSTDDTARLALLKTMGWLSPDVSEFVLSDYLQSEIPFHQEVKPAELPYEWWQRYSDAYRCQIVVCSPNTVLLRNSWQTTYLHDCKTNTMNQWTPLRDFHRFAYDHDTMQLYAVPKQGPLQIDNVAGGLVFGLDRYRLTRPNENGSETLVYKDSVPIRPADDRIDLRRITNVMYDSKRKQIWIQGQLANRRYVQCAMRLDSQDLLTNIPKKPNQRSSEGLIGNAAKDDRLIEWFLDPEHVALAEQKRNELAEYRAAIEKQQHQRLPVINQVTWASEDLVFIGPCDQSAVLVDPRRPIFIDPDGQVLIGDQFASHHGVYIHHHQQGWLPVSWDKDQVPSTELEYVFAFKDHVYRYNPTSTEIEQVELSTGRVAKSFMLGLKDLRSEDFVYDPFRRSLWVYGATRAYEFPLLHSSSTASFSSESPARLAFPSPQDHQQQRSDDSTDEKKQHQPLVSSALASASASSAASSFSTLGAIGASSSLPSASTAASPSNNSR